MFHGCRQEVMWALGESLSLLAPDVNVHFRTSVVKVDCQNTILETTGETQGTFKFDLIVGADGVGSTVRKAMVEAFDEVNATRVIGEDYAYTLYLDNHEVVSKMDPNKFVISDIMGNGTVYSPLRHTNNKEACAIVNMNSDIRNVEHAR